MLTPASDTEVQGAPHMNAGFDAIRLALATLMVLEQSHFSI